MINRCGWIPTLHYSITPILLELQKLVGLLQRILLLPLPTIRQNQPSHLIFE